MSNFIICARNVEGLGNKKKFGSEPGNISYVIVPDDATDFTPNDRQRNEAVWLAKLTEGRILDDVLVYIHGYNMDRDVTLERHKILKAGLKRQGWKGELITFAWPSKKHTLLYWEDRFDGLDVAYQLVSKCIKLLNSQIQNGCNMSVHVIAHSTGALIVREGFKIAQSAMLQQDAVWSVGQMIFIAGDISSESMEGSESDALYRHSGRITNYFSNYDSALQVSNAKRVGFANRVGRIGLPKGSPDKAVDVNCSDHYKAHEEEFKTSVVNAALSHSWYFWSDTFLQDLHLTLEGQYDRNVIPTRYADNTGEFWLKNSM